MGEKSNKGQEVLKFLLPFNNSYLRTSGCPTFNDINTNPRK